MRGKDAENVGMGRCGSREQMGEEKKCDLGRKWGTGNSVDPGSKYEKRKNGADPGSKREDKWE
eukprot:1153245-Pelagomonas_calceolata.AAC.7